MDDFLCALCARSDPATLFSFLVLFLSRRMSDAFEASFLLVVIVFSFRVVAWSVGKQYMQCLGSSLPYEMIRPSLCVGFWMWFWLRVPWIFWPLLRRPDALVDVFRWMFFVLIQWDVQRYRVLCGHESACVLRVHCS